MPHPRAWPVLTLLGVLLLGFGNGAVVWAELTVPSGLTAVLVATVPFWMVGVNAMAPAARGAALAASSRSHAQPSDSTHHDTLTLRRFAGLVVGFIGIVMLVWPEIRMGESGRGFLIGVISTQIACCGWAIGSTYERRRGHNDARHENLFVNAAFEMLFGGVVLLLVGLALGEWSRLAFTTRTTLALGHLILFGAIAGFSAYAYALKFLPVTTVSLYAYINPIIAVVLGTVVLREPFNVRMAIAAAVVLIGIALVRD